MKAWIVYFKKPLAYADACKLQNDLVTARIADKIPDTVLFLEHAPVITLGVKAQPRHVLLGQAELAARNISLVRTTRGGDVTYHGPGQLVMYPVLKLIDDERDTRDYLQNLEETAIRTAADFGVHAFRRYGMTGAWTSEGKLAAIGIRLKRWVSCHGMSFNVAPDLSHFDTIVPCGLASETVTSLKALLGSGCPAIAEVRNKMSRHFGAICQRKPVYYQSSKRIPRTLRKLLEPFKPTMQAA